MPRCSEPAEPFVVSNRASDPMNPVEMPNAPSLHDAMPAGLSGGRALARPSTSLAPRVVVVGGGFAGVTAALELARACAGVLPVHVTLLSDRNFFLFTPMLAEAATGAVETRHVLYPIRPLCGH